MRAAMYVVWLLVLTIPATIALGHSTDELTKEFGQVPENIAKITAVYEKALRQGYQASPDVDPYQREAATAHWESLLAQMHSTQHAMLLEHQKSLILTKCLETLKRISALQRQAKNSDKAGNHTEAQQRVLDEAKAWASVNCSSIPK